MAVKKAQMMPTFAYEGVDRKGVKIKGELPARNMALAKVTHANKALPSRRFGRNVRIFWRGYLRKKSLH